MADKVVSLEERAAAEIERYREDVRAFAKAKFKLVEQRGASKAELAALLEAVYADVGQTVEALAAEHATPMLLTRINLDLMMLRVAIGVLLEEAPGFGTPELRIQLEESLDAALEGMVGVVPERPQ
jgi:hypothetical protein